MNLWHAKHVLTLGVESVLTAVAAVLSVVICSAPSLVCREKKVHTQECRSDRIIYVLVCICMYCNRKQCKIHWSFLWNVNNQQTLQGERGKAKLSFTELTTLTTLSKCKRDRGEEGKAGNEANLQHSNGQGYQNECPSLCLQSWYRN